MHMMDYYSYDDYGNAISSRRVNYKAYTDQVDEITYPFIRTETDYVHGNYTSKTRDARGNEVVQEVNANDGTLTSVTDPTGQEVEYVYDASKRVTEVRTVDTKGTADTSDDVLYKNVYTYENDRIKTVSHNTTSDTPDVTYTFGYDELGRKTTVKVGDQTLSTNVYENDRNGLLSEVQYGNGGKVGYTYDEFDRLTGVKYDGEANARYEYKYGANGMAAEVEDHNLGRIARTDYDQADRPCQTELRDSATGAALYKTGLKYNKLNQLEVFSEKTGSESHKSEYTYDRDNRVTEIVFDGGSQKVSYTYDELGRVTTRTAECGVTAGKLTSAYEYVDGGYGTNSTTPLVKKITLNGISFEYAYDTRGNITSKAQYAYVTTSTLGAPVDTISYTYGDSNWKDKLTGYDGQTITYDAIGNPTNDGMWTYAWQAGRQLTRMSREGQQLTYKYDHNGMRIQKILEHD